MTMALNEKLDPVADAIYDAHPAAPGGGFNLWLTSDEVHEYNSDPDLYVARHLGFATAEQYREWVKTEGTALCSERTKSGRLCHNSIAGGHGTQRNAVTWLQLHRSAPCHVHGKPLQ